MIDCDLFEVHVDELVREQTVDAILKEQMLNHVRHCPECGIRLSAARELAAGLADLAAMHAGDQAPARVETALLSCLREQRNAWRKRRRQRWLAAAATIISAGAGVWSWQRFLPAHRHPLITTEPAPTVRPDQATEVKQKSPPRVHSQMKAAVAQVAFPAQDSSFILLPYGQDAPSFSGAQIVRVAVTPAALASMGVPVTDPSAAAYLEAEVVVGDDGVARAIRLGSDSNQ